MPPAQEVRASQRTGEGHSLIPMFDLPGPEAGVPGDQARPPPPLQDSATSNLNAVNIHLNLYVNVAYFMF